MSEKRPSLRKSFVLSVLAIALAVSSIGLVVLPGNTAPIATWQFGPDRNALQPFDQVPMYDDMRLTVDMPFDGYVYVASFDHLHGTVGYYPTEYLGTDHYDPATDRMNALAAGQHQLPGPWDGKDQTWYVPNVEETISLCVVVSRAPLTDLEQTLARCRQFGNKAFSDRSMGFYMPRAGKDALVGRRKLPHAVLKAAQNQRDSVEAGPMVPWEKDPGVYIKVLNIVPAKARPGTKLRGNPFQKKLDGMVQKKLGSTSKAK